MYYFIFTFQVSINLVLIATGVTGRISLIKSENPKSVKFALDKYYLKLYPAEKKLLVEILKIREVDKETYNRSVKEFIIL